MAKIKNFPVSQGVNIVTIGSKADRCTIGYLKIGRMIQVAVSYCAPDDKWKAIIGRNIVAGHMQWAVGGGSANVISLPMGKMRDDDIQDILIGMFFGFDNN
jgi:hypothetical protein